VSARLAVCVLPFANMSGDAEQEYFSDGISEDIITDLSKVSSLIVVSRNSAFTFKGRAVDVAQVARQLDVSHILEGSVRKSGGRLRITAQLVDGVTGGHVWAERFDRTLDNIFAIQDEISRAIVAALKLKLLPAEEAALKTRGTANPDAYNLYLMARKFYLTGSLSSTRRYEAILRLCRRALEIDPNYAQAWALLATGQASLSATGFGAYREDGVEAAERALALNPGLAEAYVARARAKIAEADFEGAVADAHAAQKIDPESYEVNYISGVAHFALRRYPQCRRLWRKASALSESEYLASMMLMTAANADGDADEARLAARDLLARVETLVAREPDNGTALAAMVGALACLGEAERARALAARALLIDPDNIMMRYNIARAFSAGLKDADGALGLLEPVFARLTPGALAWVKIEVDFDPLRENPRFRALLASAEARLTAN